MTIEHLDVVIVGAGLSGIGAAYHLQKNCPGKSYALIESREAIGGTWDLFRYPGIRSDSDMYTLGYSFKPWTNAKAIADGPSILQYVRDTAREHDIERHIRFGLRVVKASWSTPDACWSLELQRVLEGQAVGEVVQLTCNFMFMCNGYYRYDQGYTPEFAGIERFAGRVVHPQQWPADIDYTNKKVVVIGSGATAVTLVPSMAQTAAHVTMLQRSPTYILSMPAQDKLANGLRRVLPASVAYGITRWKNVLLGMFFYRLSKRQPGRIKGYILKNIRAALGPDYDVKKHFSPSYKPWDQRVCLVPDGDLFKAIREGKASVVTDHIENFTETGIKLRSGQELQADLVVTATGLQLQATGGVEFLVDGKALSFNQTYNYKGMMFSGVPNLAKIFGYTNASWTLKSDLTSEYACRLLNHMKQHGLRQCTPHLGTEPMVDEPWIDFQSGYILRAAKEFPKQGSKSPWKLYQNYLLDLMSLRFGKVNDGVMEFSNPG